jgi:hypothetical protein
MDKQLQNSEIFGIIHYFIFKHMETQSQKKIDKKGFIDYDSEREHETGRRTLCQQEKG